MESSSTHGISLTLDLLCVFTAQLIGLDTIHQQAISGHDIDLMNEMQLEKIINSVSVFYRVTPKHKLAIVKALQNSGNIVAMTGDGVNGNLMELILMTMRH